MWVLIIFPQSHEVCMSINKTDTLGINFKVSKIFHSDHKRFLVLILGNTIKNSIYYFFILVNNNVFVPLSSSLSHFTQDPLLVMSKDGRKEEKDF